MSRVVHFEIQAENPERAMRFYEALFGWLAYCKNTEGSIFGMMQMDAGAK